MLPNAPKHPLETGDNLPAKGAIPPPQSAPPPPPSAAGDRAKTQPQSSPSRHPTQEEAEEGDPATEDGSSPDPN